ncbi:hypothetical protein BJY24_006097 [Nocardia transvalensis]|uniref:Thioesterase superfamily protein n=1 Tax=Nocardia transvalensis TaxID=37333 RepID=A0A7W9PJN6_9NOCA|nr:hypothetical protein [Nocardia transvalensis]MBB5917185.1 hypothetical protein [Nocardia transvalensis]
MGAVETLTVPEHVHGYPEVAFGGYIAGLLARRVGAPAVRVDFRSLVPVGTGVGLGATGSGWALTGAGDMVLAEATPSVVAIAPPRMPTWAEAKQASETALAERAEAVDCYGCGDACAPGRGLRQFPGRLPDRELVAAAWTPDQALAEAGDELPPEVVWSALDCPGGIAGIQLAGMRFGAFTAALTATQLHPVHAGREYITYAWPVAAEGRKYTFGIALSSSDGELCALAEALWIGPKT